MDQGREKAEEASDEAAKYSLYIFAGLLVAMFVTAFAGQAGVRTYQDANVDNTAVK